MKHLQRTGGSLSGHLTFSEKKGGCVENWVTRYQNLGIGFIDNHGYMYTCNTLMASTQIMLFFRNAEIFKKKTFQKKKRKLVNYIYIYI